MGLYSVFMGMSVFLLVLEIKNRPIWVYFLYFLESISGSVNNPKTMPIRINIMFASSFLLQNSFHDIIVFQMF